MNTLTEYNIACLKEYYNSIKYSIGTEFDELSEKQINNIYKSYGFKAWKMIQIRPKTKPIEVSSLYDLDYTTEIQNYSKSIGEIPTIIDGEIDNLKTKLMNKNTDLRKFIKLYDSLKIEYKLIEGDCILMILKDGHIECRITFNLDEKFMYLGFED